MAVENVCGNGQCCLWTFELYTVQASSHTVNVHCLRSQAGRAVLNKDDFVCDVAADKEQVQRQFYV